MLFMILVRILTHSPQHSPSSCQQAEGCLNAVCISDTHHKVTERRSICARHEDPDFHLNRAQTFLQWLQECDLLSFETAYSASL